MADTSLRITAPDGFTVEARRVLVTWLSATATAHGGVLPAALLPIAAAMSATASIGDGADIAEADVFEAVASVLAYAASPAGTTIAAVAGSLVAALLPLASSDAAVASLVAAALVPAASAASSTAALSATAVIQSHAASMLGAEAQGLALDFTDQFWLAATGHYGSAKVIDTGTPANNFDSIPDALLTYTGTTKLCRQSDGVYRYGPHNLYVNSAAPANQSITVVSGASYAVTITGSVSVTASGAATGTWTAGTNTFTAATATLTLGSTSGSGTVHVRRTPSDSTYLATGASAKYGLPFEWDTSGVLQGILVEPQATNLARTSINLASAYWGAIRSTITANAAVAPDGTTTAATLTATSADGFLYQACESVSGQSHCGTVFIKRKTGSGVVRLIGADGSRSVVSISSSWNRYSVVKTSSTTMPYIGVELATAGDEVHVWQADLVLGVATSPILTYGSQVTRAADNIYLDASALPSTANEYSVAAFVATAVPSLAAAVAAAVATNGSGAYGVGNLSLLRFNSQDSAAVGGFNSDVSKTFSGGTSGGVKIGGAFRKSDARMAVTAKGQSVATVTTLDWTGAHNRLQFGALNSSGIQSLSGHIQALVLVPRYDESFIIARTA